MTRRLLALFGMQAAAQIVPTGNGGAPKRRNGECPVCKTMAEPFRPTLEGMFGGDICLPPRHTGDPRYLGATNSVCRVPDKDDLPKARHVRCANCSVVFVQDAEVSQ